MSRLPRCPRPAVIRPQRYRKRRAAAVAALAVASFGLAACTGGQAGTSSPASNGKSFVSGDASTTVYGAGKGPLAPPVTGTTLAGSKVSLSGLRGRVVVMNFWGSWCSPCRAEAPTLAALARHYQPAGVRFLGVDIRDDPANAAAFQRNFGISYPSLNDPGDEIALDFRSTVPPAGIPTTLVISGDGRIASRVIGEVTYSGLRGLISHAMAHPA